jgi:hypothetical protein
MSINENKLPSYHPLIIAWNAYKEREEYAAIRTWAGKEQHVEGSLWDAFMCGWMAFREIRDDEVETLKKHQMPRAK